MLKNRSGQFIYFTLVSATSGTPVTGASGSISGRKSLDGLSGMIVLSGNIIELGGGSYRANLYDFDTNGDQAGFLFTAFGAVPVQYHFDMIDGQCSGNVWPASGVNVVVPIASISGAVANSGLFVSVPIASISGVQPISGATVNVPIASISGAQPISGATVTVPITSVSGVTTIVLLSTLSGIQPISGTFVNVPIASISGVQPISGSFVSVPIASISGVRPISGTFVSVPIDTISGVAVNTASGSIFIASGSITSGVISSGIFVTAIATVASGIFVTVPIASISGVQAASGLFATVPIATISGVQPISGSFVSVPIASISGIQAASGLNVITGSGQVNLASGVLGVGIPKAVLTWQWSGQAAISGQRNLMNADRKLMNRWDTTSVSGYLVVYEEDDTTIAFEQAITTLSGALPITSLNTRE